MQIKFNSKDIFRYISTGFWISRAFSTILELGIIDILIKKEHDINDLVKKTKFDKRSLEVLLRFLHIFKLVKIKDSKYHATTLLKKYFLNFKEFKFIDEYKINENLWNRFSLLTNIIKGKIKKSNTEKYFSSLNESEINGFLNTMHQQGIIPSKIICSKAKLKKPKYFLDLGCGLGTYSIPFLQKYPMMNAILVDTSSISKHTEIFMNRYNYGKRVQIISNDFFKMIPNYNYDAILLSKILHDWDDKSCLNLLNKIRSKLNDNGSLIIHEEIILDETNPDFWPVIMDLFLFTVMNSGMTRSKKQISILLKKSGFSISNCFKISNFTSLIIARKL